MGYAEGESNPYAQPNAYGATPVQPNPYSNNLNSAYGATEKPIDINLSKEPTKADRGHHHDQHYEAEINLESYEERPDRCGALGDCLGWNSPESAFEANRNQLIRRVMTIVFLQLVVVAGECAFFYGVSSVRAFIQDAWWMLLIAIVFEFVTLFILFCVRKKTPLNLIVLFFFTISTGYMIASVIAFYNVGTIIEAAVICMVLVGTLMIYTLVNRTSVKWLGVCM